MITHADWVAGMEPAAILWGIPLLVSGMVFYIMMHDDLDAKEVKIGARVFVGTIIAWPLVIVAWPFFAGVATLAIGCFALYVAFVFLRWLLQIPIAAFRIAIRGVQ